MAVCQLWYSVAALLPPPCQDWSFGCSPCECLARESLDPPFYRVLLKKDRKAASWRPRATLLPLSLRGKPAVLRRAFEAPGKQVIFTRRKVRVLAVQSENGVTLTRKQAENGAAHNGVAGQKKRLDIAALIAPTLAGTKVCDTCHEEKVVGDFKAFKTSPDGLSYQCRGCTAEEVCRKADQPFPQASLEGRECTACNRFKAAKDFCIFKGKLEPRCRSCKRSIERNTRTERAMLEKKRCSFCNQIKPAVDFYPLRKAASGLLAWCKDCNRLNALRRYQERPQLPEPRVQSKRCASCKEVKPASEFHAWRKGPDGLQGYCKKCSTRRCMESYYNASRRKRESLEGSTSDVQED